MKYKVNVEELLSRIVEVNVENEKSKKNVYERRYYT